MRIRTIKPEFWTDKRVASWDTFTRLLYIGTWSAADDYGRGSAEPARIAAELFPYDLSRDSRETLANVSRGFAKLSEASRIMLYSVHGEQFFQIMNWSKHQRVDKPGKSRIPEPCAEDVEAFATLSRHSRDTLATGTGNREQGSWSVEQVTEEQGTREQDCAYAPASREAKAKREKFHPPTIEECKARAAQLNLPAIEADKFLSYYQSNGWKVGRNPMKCWKAAMATWAANWQSRGNPGAKPVKDWYQGSVAQRRNLEMGYTDEIIAENTRRRQEIIDAQERELKAEIAAKAASLPVGASELPGLGDGEGGT